MNSKVEELILTETTESKLIQTICK
jgi:hypothetical protein